MKIDPEIPSSIRELAVVLSQKFEAVLLEADPQMLSQLVADAEAAIFLRFQSLDNSPDGHAERDALGDQYARCVLSRRGSCTIPTGTVTDIWLNAFPEVDLECIVAKHKFGPYVEDREQSTWIKILNRNYSQKVGREGLFEPGEAGADSWLAQLRCGLREIRKIRQSYHHFPARGI